MRSTPQRWGLRAIWAGNSQHSGDRRHKFRLLGNLSSSELLPCGWRHRQKKDTTQPSQVQSPRQESWLPRLSTLVLRGRLRFFEVWSLQNLEVSLKKKNSFTKVRGGGQKGFENFKVWFYIDNSPFGDSSSEWLYELLGLWWQDEFHTMTEKHFWPLEIANIVRNPEYLPRLY